MPTLKSTLASVSKYDAWIWSRIDAGPQPSLVPTYLEFRDPEGSQPLTVITVISVVDPLRALHENPTSGLTWHTASGAVSAVAVPTWSDDTDGFVVSSWPAPMPYVHHLASTVPATDRRWTKFERWLRQLAPSVNPVYLDRSDFDGSVSILAEHGEVDASRLTGRYRSDHSSYSRGWPNPKPARAALEEIATEVQLRTMTLSVLDPERSEMLLRVHLRRLAGATFYSGDFALFNETVLSRLAVAADRRAQLFRNRVRTLEEPDVSPVEINIGISAFEQPDQLSHFFDRIVRYSDSATAILHRNPYAHVAVTDYSDGSNFDVFVTASDRITVYPGFRASVGSFVRLTDYLSEEFEADGVGAEPPSPPLASLADVFSTD